MKTDKITVTDLFEKQRRYLVPLFQRGYVWTLEDQWKLLWQDIVDLTKALQQHNGLSKREMRKHFLGAVVLNQANVSIRHVPVSEVIDGQQRLTTLQVLLAALRDVIRPLDNAYLNAKLERLTKNEGPWPGDFEQFKVWLTNAYQQDFKTVMTTSSRDVLEKQYPIRWQRRKKLPRPALVEAYLFFWNAIVSYLQGNDDAESISASIPISTDRAELLLTALTGNIQLVEISLDAEDDPQIIFETLNARGVRLEPSDLIRNFVFLYATRHEEDVEMLYEKYWKEFEEAPTYEPKNKTGKFWKEKERQGRLLNNRLDLFFYHYLTYRTGEEFKISHIFQQFRDWWEDQDRVMATELERLVCSAKVFRSLLQPNDKDRFGVFASRLKILDTTTVYPLLLMLAENRDKIPENEFNGMIEDLESYLIRRMVCGLTPKNYNRIFLSLLKSLQSENIPNRASLQRELLSMEGESSVWPNHERFCKDWLEAAIYHRLRPAQTQMILKAIELGLHTPLQEDVRIGGFLTIEHIMPQNGNPTDWPLPTKPDGQPDLVSIFRRNQLREALGNLTLLTQPLNSSVSNGSFAIKRVQIAQQSQLRLNAYFQRFSDTDVWNEEAILAHGRELFGVARRIWPYPLKDA